MKSIKLLILSVFCAGMLHAIVGDWVSYGSQLTLTDLRIDDKILYAASHGGLVSFDIQNTTFLDNSRNETLEHIDILSYYVNVDGSEWYSYASGTDGITCVIPGLRSDYFDYDFSEASVFAGDSLHVFVAFMQDLSPGIAHFVKANNRYIFQDVYNQFPLSPESIQDIEILHDSLFVGTEKGLIAAWIYTANLKPENAWSVIPLDSSESITCMYSDGQQLFYSNGDNDLYRYAGGHETRIINNDIMGIMFCKSGDKTYFANQKTIYDLSSKTEIYTTSKNIAGFAIQHDTLWVSEEDNGLCRVILNDNSSQRFIPNTMLYSRANSLAITDDQRVAVCGLNGISILDDGRWHNLMFSRYLESIDDGISTNSFSADTLNIAFKEGGSSYVADALVSTAGKLICSISDVDIIKYSNQSPEAEGPGALEIINLDNYEDYVLYDTTQSVIDGTQGLGIGASYYIKMGGVAEDPNGNIWVINRHTLAGETLIKILPDGSFRKYSVDESGHTLQILAREMLFDNYGHLWIANEARQSDEPRTTGGITVFDPETEVWALVTTSDGLASNDVYSIDIDPLTGNIWAATAGGVQMIRTPSTFNSQSEFDMNLPIDGLNNMIPVKLRIDPQGNKWILTQSQGVQIYMTNNRWFDDGNGLKTENSRLLDDVVYDLVFDTQSGYAYLLTASGLSRYEIAWTADRTDMADVTVFPQPFTPGLDEYLAIDGLAEQSHVRIATIDGRVLIQFSADSDQNLEKQVVWDGILPNGNYIPRGVYLAFITNIDGLKKTVKFAVK